MHTVLRNRPAAFAIPIAMAIGLAAMSGLPAAVAQPAADPFRCADVSPSRSRTPAYGRIAGAALCEGFFEQSVSQPFVELLSLTSSPLPDAAATTVDIRTATSPARVTVQPLRSGPFYRVDALVGTAPLRWHAAPMLQATGLQWRDLGFLARTAGSADASSPPSYTPVSLSVPGAPVATATRVTAVLRPSVRISGMAWRMQGGAWAELTSGTTHAFQRVTLPIELPASAGNGSKEGVDIDVQALDAEGKPLPMLSFRIPGAGGAAR